MGSLAERMKELKNKQNESLAATSSQASGSSTGSGLLAKRMRERNLYNGKVVSDVYENYNSLADGYNDVYQKISRYADTSAYKPATTGTQYASEVTKYSQSAKNLLNEIASSRDTYVSAFGEDSVKEIEDSLSSISTGIGGLSSELDSLNDYWSQFSDEDTWKTINTEATMNEKYGTSYSERKKAADTVRAVNAGLEDVNSDGAVDAKDSLLKKKYTDSSAKDVYWLKKNMLENATASEIQQEADKIKSQMDNLIKEKTSDINRYTSKNILTSEIQSDSEKEYKNLYQQYQTIQSLAEQKQYEEKYQKKYGWILESEDYESRSKTVDSDSKAWGDQSTDPLYAYINKTKTAKIAKTKLSGTDYWIYDQMTDEEKGIYNYLYATNGNKKAAEAYLKDIEPELTSRNAQVVNENAANFAKNHPVIASAVSVGDNLLAGQAYGQNLWDYATTGKIDENKGANVFSQSATTIRNTISKDIEENVKSAWGKVGSFAYNTGMSMADFLTSTAITGGASGASLAILGSSAAVTSTITAKQRGLSDGQSFLLGTIAGAAEVVTEKFSLDALFKSGSTGIKYILQNIFTEGSEEVGSDFINLFADIMISKDQSEWEVSVKGYEAQGMTEQEAFFKAIGDQAAQIGLDFLGGAISGGVMAGGATALQAAGEAVNKKSTAATAQANAAIAAGLSLDPNTEGYQKAVALKAVVDSGETVPAAEVTALETLTANATAKTEPQNTAESVVASENMADTDFNPFTDDDTPAASEQTFKTTAGQLYGSSGKYETSDDGKNYVKSSGKTIEINGLERVKNGEAYLKTSEGVLPASAVSFENDETAGVYETASTYNPTKAQAYVMAYQYGKLEGSAISPDDFTQFFNNVYDYGYNGIGEKNGFDIYGGVLTEKQIQTAYRYGNLQAKAETQERQGAVDKKVSQSRNNAPAYKAGISEKTESRVQYKNDSVKADVMKNSRISASVKVLEFVSRGTKIKFFLYDSSKADNETDTNGWYDPKTNTIGIDIRSDVATESVILRTAAHELTHFMKGWAPAQYEKLQSFILEQYANAGTSASLINEVQKKQEEYRSIPDHPVELTASEALEEIVADGCEMMLMDSDAPQKLAALDTEIASKSQNWIQEFIEKIRNFIQTALSGVQESAGSISTELRAMDEQYQKIAAIWSEGITEAAGNYRTVAESDTSEKQKQTDVKYSINPDFERKYDEWSESGKKGGGYIELGTTAKALESIGINPADIYWDYSKINNILKDHPDMTDEIIKQVPRILENPVIIMQSVTVINRVTILGEVYDTSGKPVLAALELKPNGRIQDFVKMTSAYGKNAQGLINESTILYLDPDKKRTDTWFQALRLQLPAGVTTYGSIGKVTYSEPNVKGEIEFPSKQKSKTAGQVAFEKMAAEQGLTLDQYMQKLKGEYTDGNEWTERKLSQRRELTKALYKTAATDKEKNLLVEYMGNIDKIEQFVEERDDASAQLRTVMFQSLFDPETQKTLKALRDKLEYRRGQTDDVSRQERKDTRREIERTIRAKYLSADDYHRANYLEAQIEALYGKRDAASIAARDSLKEELSALLGNMPTKDTNQMEFLRSEVARYNKEIDKYDRIVLQIESMESVRRLFDRDRKAQAAKQKEIRKQQVDTFKETQMQHDYIDRVIRETNRLALWITEPGTKGRVPEQLATPVTEFLTSIDFSSKRLLNGNDPTMADKKFQLSIQKLKKVISGIENDSGVEYLDLPPEYLEEMEAISLLATELSDKDSGKFVLRNMNSESLKRLHELIKTLKTSIQKVNQFYDNQTFKTVALAAEDTINYTEKIGKDKPHSKTADFLRGYLNWNLLNPVYAFERMGEGAMSLFDGARRGFGKYAIMIQEIIDFAEKTWTDEEIISWRKNHPTVKIRGTNVKMSIPMIMTLFETAKREQALTHLDGSGIRVTDLEDAKGKIIKNEGDIVTWDECQAIFALLTPRQIEVADAIQKFMQEKGAEWINEVSLKRWGVRIAAEGFYFPIKTDSESRNIRFADDDDGEANLYSIIYPGYTKNTVRNANNRIIINDIFDLFADHMSHAAQHNAFAIPVLNMLKWINYRTNSQMESGQIDIQSVRQSLRTAFGKHAENYVISLLKNLNGKIGENGGEAERLMLSVLKNTNKAAVGANMSVALLQGTALGRAMLVLNMDEVGKAAVTSLPQLKTLIEEMEAHSGIAVWKHMGFYDVNVSKSLSTMIKHDEKLTDKITDISMKLPEIADRITWATIWNACKINVNKNGTFANQKEYWNKVTDLFEDVIYRTQVVDSVLTKSKFMTNKNFITKMVSSFMSESVLTYNTLLSSVNGYMMDKRQYGAADAWTRNSKKIAKAFYIYALVQILGALVRTLNEGWRDDDDTKDIVEKYLDKLPGNVVEGLNPFSLIPFVSQLWELLKIPTAEIMKTFGIETDLYGFDVSLPGQEAIQEIADAFKLFGKYREGNEVGSPGWYPIAFKAMQAASSLSGIPLANATREAVSLWNNTVAEFNPEMRLQKYKTSSEEYGEALYGAIVDGDTDKYNDLVDKMEIAGKTETEVHTAIIKALKEDSRAIEAAQLLAAGENKQYETILADIIADGFDQNDAVDAIQSLKDALTATEEETSADPYDDTLKSIYEYSDVYYAIDTGNKENVSLIVSNMMSYAEDEKQFKSSTKRALTTTYKQKYRTSSGAERAKIKNMLYATRVYDNMEALEKVLAGWLEDDEEK